METPKPKIAVLITCHNRRELTLRCLSSLSAQPSFDPRYLFLVDDGSSDGTGDSVRAAYPLAQVIQGNGDLFWNGGTNAAWAAALSSEIEFEFYLWLNDDVVLDPDALEMLLTDASAISTPGSPVIVAGSTIDPTTKNLSYGGHLVSDALHPLRTKLAIPAGCPTKIDSFSGNVVLVSAAAERQLGHLSSKFKHIFGDIDYGFRARYKRIPIWLGSSVVGTCANNPGDGSQNDHSLSRWRRIEILFRKERTIHARDWRAFVREHSGLGPLSFLYSLSPYVRIMLQG